MSEQEYAKVIAKNLRNIFYKNNKTQAEVAKDLGISKATLSSWMNGTRIPRMAKIDLLCHYFNCTRADIMEKPSSDGSEHGYYTDLNTARIAQEMFEDPQMRALFHMKKGMDPEKFQAHYDMMKKMYELEHPEDTDDFDGC